MLVEEKAGECGTREKEMSHVGSWKVSMIQKSRSREFVETVWLLC